MSGFLFFFNSMQLVVPKAGRFRMPRDFWFISLLISVL